MYTCGQLFYQVHLSSHIVLWFHGELNNEFNKIGCSTKIVKPQYTYISIIADFQKYCHFITHPLEKQECYKFDISEVTT